jgi:hypothetical protein
MTRLLVAAESLSRAVADRDQLAELRDELVRLGVASPGEELEPVDRAAASAPGPGRIVVVVREQLDDLNAVYCRAVLDLETFTDFDSFVVEAIGSGHHDFAKELGPLLDAPDKDVVVVPFSRLQDGAAVPGPMLVTAMRWLNKRLTRVGALLPIDPALVVQAAAEVRQHAEAHEWDHTPYWGWSEDLANEAVEHFRPGNDQFARRAWGTEWPDPPVRRDRTRVDLAGCPPAVVSDVLTTIQQAVDGARKGESPSGDDSGAE